MTWKILAHCYLMIFFGNLGMCVKINNNSLSFKPYSIMHMYICLNICLSIRLSVCISSEYRKTKCERCQDYWTAVSRGLHYSILSLIVVITMTEWAGRDKETGV